MRSNPKKEKSPSLASRVTERVSTLITEDRRDQALERIAKALERIAAYIEAQDKDVGDLTFTHVDEVQEEPEIDESELP